VTVSPQVAAIALVNSCSLTFHPHMVFMTHSLPIPATKNPKPLSCYQIATSSLVHIAEIKCNRQTTFNSGQMENSRTRYFYSTHRLLWIFVTSECSRPALVSSDDDCCLYCEYRMPSLCDSNPEMLFPCVISYQKCTILSSI
jgi:hypothetical protein